MINFKTITSGHYLSVISGAVIILVVCIIGSTDRVDAISCWQCNSMRNSHCMNVPAGPVEDITKLEPCYREMYAECGDDNSTSTTGSGGDNPSTPSPSSPDSQIGGGIPFCRTQYQTIIGAKRVIRSCAREASPTECYMTRTPSVQTHVCQCFSDGCNSAPGVGGASRPIIAIASIIAIVIAFR